MKIITRRENMVYKEIKYMQMDLTSGVPEDMLKRTLDLPEHDYHEIIEMLHKKGLISRNNGKITVNNIDEDIKVMETQKEVKVAELNQVEDKALQIIVKLSGEGPVPRYILEGHLLYGPLKLSNFRMYHVIISLENKGVIERVFLEDGEYYRVTCHQEPPQQ